MSRSICRLMPTMVMPTVVRRAECRPRKRRSIWSLGRRTETASVSGSIIDIASWAALSHVVSRVSSTTVIRIPSSVPCSTVHLILYGQMLRVLAGTTARTGDGDTKAGRTRLTCGGTAACSAPGAVTVRVRAQRAMGRFMEEATFEGSRHRVGGGGVWDEEASAVDLWGISVRGKEIGWRARVLRRVAA